LNIKAAALIQLAESRSWTIPKLAERLGVDYSYLFRVLNNEKKGGAKLFAGIYRLCKEENLSFDDYMEFETLEAFNQIKNSTR